MGRFFNEKLMPLKRIPRNQTFKNNPVEQMRKDFNEEHKIAPATAKVPMVNDEERQKVLDRMAKARAGRGKKNG